MRKSIPAQLEDKLDTKVCQICLEFRKVTRRIIRGDTTSNGEMSNIERQATWKRSGINSGSARTVHRNSHSLCNRALNK